MKRSLDPWMISAYCLFGLAVFLAFFGEDVGFPNRFLAPIFIAACSTIPGRDGYASDKSAADKSVHKLFFWLLVGLAFLHLLRQVADA